MNEETDEFSQAILQELGRSGYEPRRTKELARQLGVPKGDYPAFRDTVRELQRQGRIIRRGGGHWTLSGGAAEEQDLILGRLQITRSGCGFLIPEDSSQDDLFIPEDNLEAALDGDLVKVRIERSRGNDYRACGKVVEIVERGSPRLVALIKKDGRAQPEDPKNPYHYELEPGGPAVKPGEKVLLEVTVWPDEEGGPRGRVLEILGPAGEPDTETAAILAKYEAPGLFPEEVKEEVRHLAYELSASDRTERLDLTGLTIFTIDPRDARDFDDALSVEELPDGALRVGVHIADVSHYVKPGSAADREARERATSIYLPDRVIPMIPEELSNNLCSLRPDEVRPTKTVFIHYDRNAKRTNYSIHRSFIRSCRRFTYEEVKVLLDAGEAAAGETPEVLRALRILHELAQTIRSGRREGGAIELSMPEFKVLLDENRLAQDIVMVPHDESHQLVEEFMLAANAAVAEWAGRNGLGVLHRVHAPPAEESVEELAAFLTASGYPFKLPFRRDRLNAVLAKVAGRPEEHAINLAILKSFTQAIYAPDAEIGHFALNFPHYLHFTSPIRRYPDLHLHQQLEACFSSGAEKLPKRMNKLPERGGKALESLGKHTSGRERRAAEIENAVKDFRRLELLSRREQRDFLAVVTGIRKFGIFVEIEKYFVESMIPRWMLEKKGFSTREEPPAGADAGKKRRGLRGGGQAPGFHLGQMVRVRITRIDLPARLCEMEFLGLKEQD